jgi:hypothetical protein
MIQGTPSRAAEVVNKLNDLLNDADSFDGLQIVDGPVFDLTDLQDDAICVAPGSPTDPGFVSSFTEQTSLGRRTYVEDITVNVAISSRVVDAQDMRARRDRVMEILTDLQTVLHENRIVDGVWDDIGLGTEAVWHQVSTSKGVVCALGVLVEARALL